MNSKLLIAGFLSLVILAHSFGQGSLTPSSTPAPTMKSLAQIEPRIPISSAPFTITNSGSYYLTTNIVVGFGNAIAIATNGVTLDLNGFTISSTLNPAGGTAIDLVGVISGISIFNGQIKGSVTNNGSGVYGGAGFGYGIDWSGVPAPTDIRIANVSVSGCLYDGIFAPGIAIVDSCIVRTVGGYGIVAKNVKNCIALDTGSGAISGEIVNDSTGSCSTGGNGITATYIAQNCNGVSATGVGLNAGTAMNCHGSGNGSLTGLAVGSAENCLGYSLNGNGITADNTAMNCYGYNSGAGVGISAQVAQNCRGYSPNGRGISAFSAQNCYGESGNSFGLYANLANNCYGVTGNGGSYGVYVVNVAVGCFGSAPAGAGMRAHIANSCDGVTGVTSDFHYNMPP